jgi:hypothetical protein
MNINVDGLISALGIAYYIIVYSIGILALVFSIIAFQFKNRVAIILSGFLGQACWVIHFALQGDLSSALACALSAVMLAIFSRSDKWRWATSRFTIIFFILLLSAFSLFSFKVWSDIFPLLAGVFAVIANSRKSEKHLRRLSFLWVFFWLLNSIFKVYPIALVNDSLCTVSTVVGIIRYRDKDA